MKNLFFGLSFSVFLLSSCVSTKKFDAQSALTRKYLAEKKDCAETLKETETLLAKTSEEKASLTSENTSLKSDLSAVSKSKEKLSKLADEERVLKEKEKAQINGPLYLKYISFINHCKSEHL